MRLFDNWPDLLHEEGLWRVCFRHWLHAHALLPHGHKPGRGVSRWSHVRPVVLAPDDDDDDEGRHEGRHWLIPVPLPLRLPDATLHLLGVQSFHLRGLAGAGFSRPECDFRWTCILRCSKTV